MSYLSTYVSHELNHHIWVIVGIKIIVNIIFFLRKPLAEMASTNSSTHPSIHANFKPDHHKQIVAIKLIVSITFFSQEDSSRDCIHPPILPSVHVHSKRDHHRQLIAGVKLVFNITFFQADAELVSASPSTHSVVHLSMQVPSLTTAGRAL